MTWLVNQKENVVFSALGNLSKLWNTLFLWNYFKHIFTPLDTLHPTPTSPLLPKKQKELCRSLTLVMRNEIPKNHKERKTSSSLFSKWSLYKLRRDADKWTCWFGWLLSFYKILNTTGDLTPILTPDNTCKMRIILFPLNVYMLL